MKRLTALTAGAMLLQTGGCAVSDELMSETLNYALELLLSSILAY
jgi:hypothetical protein